MSRLCLASRQLQHVSSGIRSIQSFRNMSTLAVASVSSSMSALSLSPNNTMIPRHLIDIGANLNDSMYEGYYHNSNRQHHPSDHEHILSRAYEHGVERIILTAGTLDDTKHCIHLINKFTSSPLSASSSSISKDLDVEHPTVTPTSYPKLYTTIGYHPTNTRALYPSLTSKIPDERDSIYKQIMDTYNNEENRKHIVAIGEVGLDYDRFHFSTREEQLVFLPIAFELAVETQLPMFLHDRNTKGELIEWVRRYRSRISNVVFHSFTGTRAEMQAILEVQGYVGINGCSLKIAEQLEIIPDIPLDRLLLETDAPWCGIKKTHASFPHVKTHFEQCKKEKYSNLLLAEGNNRQSLMIKDRNEPATMIQVAEVVASLKKVSVDELIRQVHKNSISFFWPLEQK